MNFNILEAATPAQLLALYADILTELRGRGIARSTNNPAADYAEYLVARALGLALATNSTAGYDATDTATGLRYQVKGRRPTSHNPSRHMWAIRNLHDRHFDYLAGVLFEEDFSVARACLIPAAVIEREAKYIAHTDSWMLHLRDAFWAQDGVQGITAVVRAAALGEAHHGSTAPTLANTPEMVDAQDKPVPRVEAAEQMTRGAVSAVAAPKVTYTFSRFCFKVDEIEPLAMGDTFRMATKHHGTFQMTRAEFYRDFPKVREIKFYRQNRLHHSPTVSHTAARYRIST